MTAFLVCIGCDQTIAVVIGVTIVVDIVNSAAHTIVTAIDGISTTVGPTWHFTTVGFKYVYLPLVLRNH